MLNINSIFYKILIFLLLPASGFCDYNIKGKIIINGGYYYLIPEGSNKRLLIEVSDRIIRARLTCLDDGDHLSGTAKKIGTENVNINSIEYVSLNKLIASWRDENEIFTFSDFRNLYYWDFSRKNNKFHGPFIYHYALSPYGENLDQCLWKVFLIDNAGVILGSLEWFAEDQIMLKLYDSESGEVSSTKNYSM